MISATFETVFPLTILVLLGAGIPAFLMWFNNWLSPQHDTSKAKGEAYECGLSNVSGSAGDRFSLKFYLIAMLFLVFDLEVAFLYPWAVQYLKGGWDLLWILVIFLVILEAGYMYLWRKGALSFSK